jgi:cytochrome P450
LTKMTMEAIGKAGFGFDFGSFDKNAALELQSYQFIMEKMADTKYFIPFVAKLPTQENRKLNESFKAFGKLVTDLIAKKRAHPKQEGEESDLLEMLVSANDEGSKMTDEELIHNVNTFFIAGHETSSSGLHSTLYLLAKNNEAQEKARAEAKQVLHRADPTYEDIAHLNYITAVIREAMRILPPLLGFSRQAVEDCVVSGYHVPKGTIITMLSAMLHNSSEFYDEPEKFKPERWLKENENEKSNNNAAPWYPFGAGPRMCIGNHFAMLEMKAVLSMLLQNFKFTPKGELKFQRAITLKPVDSFVLGVETL